jgi:TldD protein
MKSRRLFEKIFNTDFRRLRNEFYLNLPTPSKQQYSDYYWSCNKHFIFEYVNGRTITDNCFSNAGCSHRKITGEKTEIRASSVTSNKNKSSFQSLSYPKISNNTFDSKKRLQMIQKAEKQLLNKSTIIEGLAFKWTTVENLTAILNSDGFADIKTADLSHISVNVTIRKNNGIFNGRHSASFKTEKGLVDSGEIFKLIDNSCMDAENQSIAKNINSGMYEAVLSNQVSAVLMHEIIGHLMEADYLYNDLSVVKPFLNKELASKELTITDSPLINHPVYFQFDDEGTEGRQTVLIENGRFVNILTDRYHAINMNIPLTGNGRRMDYNSNALPRMSNTIIEKGMFKFEELIKSMAAGVYITNLGNGNVNTESGLFNFIGADGFYVEKGEILYPVRNLQIFGNALEILKSIEMIGNDSAVSQYHLNCEKEDQYIPVGFKQPSLKLRGLNLSNG